MASLNLIPNPPVLAVQAVIFLANVVLVKKLFVEPYLQVKDRRDKVTIGSKDDATRLLAEAEQISQRVNERLQSAYDAAKVEREAIRNAAIAKRDDLLAAAEKDAKAHVESVERQIGDAMTREKAKVSGVVESLTDEVYRIALA